MNRQEGVLAGFEWSQVPRDGSGWADTQALSPVRPDGVFLDVASFQTDVIAQLRRDRRPRAWLFERREHPATDAVNAPVDPTAPRTSAGGRWVPWLCQVVAVGTHLRCVHVAPAARREMYAELQALSGVGVSVRLVPGARAARAILPDVLVLRERGYVLVRDGVGATVGATVVNDPKLVGRWRSRLARLHADGVGLGEEMLR